MELEEIYRRDLNLLIALTVLIEEGSVSRAASRLNLSQSAMSRVLTRLRELLNDPLFIRQGQGLVPTQRALDITLSLQNPLEELRQVLSPSEFDPATCQQHFRIATTDYAMQTILPFALARIYQEAPNISLEFAPLQHQNLAKQLTSEGCDMAICRPVQAVEPLLKESLGLVSVFCLLAKHHPLAEKELTIEDYLAFPHAMIAISDGVKALLDEALIEHPKPATLLRAYHLEAALAITDKVPVIITVPADLAYLVAEKNQLVVKPLPFKFEPFDYSLIWHARCDYSAPQMWLRNIIKQECSRLISKRVQDIGLL
ncbi:LysR family transcriptional regulator [Agarivorans sp. 1_MG-2023]|uniref:LysR family transcriptional regulator n=1 Tax=Agarivorans sp. 1_MG-2023 TaxID=3062634 RepID=UPI0026E3CAFB|nr:LysR family transcriptional regulator [Agarivorans sp. 1_MG-2023]MDO6764059.1 LysR family transcriptional regulator [Agarivorans sp. 1_MG-2023]